MPTGANDDGEAQARPHITQSQAPSDSTSWSWLRLPRPIKRIFDEFPLRTYPPNTLPQREIASRDPHILYLFTTRDGAIYGKPSFNPGCLKWQTYLNFCHIKFICMSSSNHASPTGALPFLLPAASTMESSSPIPLGRIQRWTRGMRSSKSPKGDGHVNAGPHKDSTEGNESQKRNTGEQTDDPSEMRYDAYMSLLDHSIRSAYLYSLYHIPSNFDSVVFPLYIQPTTSSYLVRLALSHQLRSAAEAELLKQANIIDVEALYRECGKAFSALSTLLGEDDYFFGDEKPTIFDASVFAYTHILLDEKIRWQDRRLMEPLEQYGNLASHRTRILEQYYSTES